jgi:cell division septal protein FtsQ
MPQVEQDLPTLLEHMNSSPIFDFISDAHLYFPRLLLLNIKKLRIVVIKVSLTMITLKDDFTINFKRQGFNAKIRRYQDVIKNKRQSQTIRFYDYRYILIVYVELCDN